MAGESPDVVLYDGSSNALAVQNGTAIPASTPALMVAGSDGTNSRYITIDGSGHPVIVGAGTAGSASGGVVTIQGVAGMTPVIAELSDGTNGPVAVKAASTAPVATDKALVVTIGPNTPNSTFNNQSVGATGAVPPADATYMGALATTAAESGLTTGDMYPLNITTTGQLRIDGGYPLATVVATAVDMHQVGGVVTTAVPAYTTATVNALSLTTVGQLRIDSAYPTGTATASAPDATEVAGIVTTAAPTYTTGQLNALSLTTAGLLRIDGVYPTAAAVGADAMQIGAAFNISNALPTSGDLYALQADQGLNLLTFPGIQFATGAAWTSATALNTLQYANGTITIGQLSSCPAMLIQLDQTTTITGGAVTFQGTYDNINWVTIPAAQVVNPNTLSSLTNPYTFIASTNQAFLIVLQGYVAIRANLTSALTGTGSVTPYWAKLPASPFTSVGPVTVSQSDLTATGTLGALNAAVTLTLAGTAGSAMQLVAGTLIGTIVPEVSIDGGTTWVATFFDDPSTGNKVPSVVFGSSNTATTRTIVGVGGASHVRVRVSAFTSGTATCNLRASVFNRTSLLSEGAFTAATQPPDAIQIGGWDGSNLRVPAVKAPSTAPAATDQALVVVLSPNQIAIPVTTTPATSTPGIAVGYVNTSAVTNVALRATTYTEQSANFTGSVSSSNANDTSAGTGARTLKITFVDSTGATAGTESVTLNGTTAVNLVTTTKCFIEKIEVVTVGSTGNNVGTISLFTGAAGGGTLVGTMAATDNRTFWSHHYVVTGKTANITGMTGLNNNSSNNTVFTLQAVVVPTANQVSEQVSDWITGGLVNQTLRIYSSLIKVPGPARVTMFAQPGGTPNIKSQGSFDFYDA